MEIIKCNNERAPLYCRFAGQYNEQPAYIEIDMESETICADYCGEVGNGLPSNVWEKRALRFRISNKITGETANNVMTEILPMAKKLLANYEINSQTRRGVANAEPEVIIFNIERLCENVPADFDVWSASDWIAETKISDLISNGESLYDAARRIADEAWRDQNCRVGLARDCKARTKPQLHIYALQLQNI